METGFTIKYDGLPNEGHAIDAVAFSKSLLATSEMFQISQKVLLPQVELKRVQLRATPEGSIDAVLELVFVGVSLFAGTPATAIANASAIVPTTWRALKRLRALGSPTTTPASGGTQTIINAETVNIDTLIAAAPRDEAQLLRDPDREPLESFSVEDAVDIDLAVDGGKILVSDSTKRYTVTAWGVSFDQFRLRIGLDETTARWAEVLDPTYRAIMEEPGAQVTNGSELDVDLRIQVYQTAGGRKSSKWYIVHVYDTPITLDGMA